MDLGDVLGQTLAIAVGIALSPFPIIGVVLLLMSPTGRASAPLFTIGRVLGLVLVLAVLLVASDAIYRLTSAVTLPAIVRIILGIGLLLLALHKWRPKPEGYEPSLPGWMSTIADARGPRAFGFGVLITVANPKELALLLTIGITLGGDQLTTSEAIWACVIIVAIGSLSVIVPVVAMLVAPVRMEPVLDSVNRWLTANSSTVMGILLLVIGAAVIGGGISEL
jgi:threonine/homoserine/homoserine lactone efflux protein